MATLVIAHPKHGRMECPLIIDTVTIGRMNDNTIQIRDDSVSGRHARITRHEGHFHLEDLGSANRCFLDGKEVSEADLTRDCRLRFGNVSCEFQLHGTVSVSVADQFSHFQKQIRSIVADRDEALRKRGDALAERDQMREELKAFLAKRQESAENVSGQNLLQRSEQWKATEQSEDLTGKNFDTVCDELRATKADAAAIRDESCELRYQVEFLAREIESLTAQRNELQRSNHQLSAKVEEMTQRMDSLKRRHKKFALDLDELGTALRQLFSDAESTLSFFERFAKSFSGAATETFPSNPAIPSTSPTHWSSSESDVSSRTAPPPPPKELAPTAERFGKERSARSTDSNSPSIKGTASGPPPRAVPPSKTNIAPMASSDPGRKNMPQIDPSPAISPAVLAGRGFTPGWRDMIHPLISDMRRLFLSFSGNRGDLMPLDQILRDAYNLSHRAATIDSNALFNLASALEALIRDVYRAPDQITESVLNTIAEALDLLELMVDEEYFRQAAQLPEGRTCVIENDLEIRNAVLGAMKTVNLEPIWNADVTQVPSVVKSRPLDLILIDRTCRFENGLDPISLVRGMQMHVRTPIIAIQEAGTPIVEGTEAISKPFNQRELAVKSLTLIFKGQLGIA